MVFAAVLVLMMYVGWHLLHVLEIVYVSALFAVVLSPVVDHIQRLRIRNWSPSQPVAVILLLAGIFGGLFLFFYLGLPPVIRDFRAFAEDLPQKLPAMVAHIKHLPMADKLGLENMSARVQSGLAATAGYIVSKLPHWAMFVLDILTAIVLTVYFIFEGGDLYRYFLSMLRSPFRERMDRTLQVAEGRVSHWLIGQLSLMAIQGVYSVITFGFLHVRYFVLLGILMGLTNIIPVAGNLVTIVLVFCVAAADSWTKAFLVLAVYGIYTQVENAYLTPRIMKQSVDLMGIAVLIALMAGSALAGIVGALVAVPSAALISVLADEFLVQPDRPEEKRPKPPDS
ncbi:MAG: AI-2E family transporter [Acidobacteria bacterium]|nr:AI-2E family transporter [Acidobacteriota bacterium]